MKAHVTTRLELPNPFPGGSIIAIIEIWQYDVGEWYWRDYMDHFMGPWGTYKQAENDARNTYDMEWESK